MILIKNTEHWNVIKLRYYNSEYTLLKDFFIKELKLSEEQYSLIDDRTNIATSWEREKGLRLIEKQIGIEPTKENNKF